jgi:hypothetical protein
LHECSVYAHWSEIDWNGFAATAVTNTVGCAGTRGGIRTVIAEA